VGDHLHTGGERGQAIDVIAVAVVRMTVVTVFGVILAMLSSSSWPPAFVVFASTTTTPLVPTITVLIAATALDPIDVRLQLVSHKRGSAWRGLPDRNGCHSSENGQSKPIETKISAIHARRSCW